MTYSLRDQDANKTHKESDLKYTDSGRKVYSGGGIDPDRRFDGPSDGFNPTRFGRSIAARNLFDTYAQQFSRRGDTRLSRTGGQTRELDANYEVNDAMLAEFKALVQKSPVIFDEASWQKDLDFIKAMIRREIDMDLFGVSVAYQNLAKRDPQLLYAVSLFPEAQQLLESSRQAQSRRAAK
jgi:carboxyl-terminal processing protease